MAKLKDQINSLKAKYGISDDAARELLALHDGDLAEANATLAEEQNKVIGWNKFWFEKAPQIQALAEEHERLKNQLEGIKTQVGVQPQTVPQAPNTNQPASTEELEKRIYQNFSAVQKDLYNIQRQHLENYKTLPDLEPIEKLIEERKMTPWAAYKEWVAPMDEKRKEEKLREQISKELTEKFQNEATRTGVNSYMLSDKNRITGEDVVSPLDEVLRDKLAQPQTPATNPQTPTQTAGTRSDPSEFELMVDFANSMRDGRNRTAH